MKLVLFVNSATTSIMFGLWHSSFYAGWFLMLLLGTAIVFADYCKHGTA